MFSHAPLFSLFKTVMGETAPFIMSAYIYIKVCMRCLYQRWLLKKKNLEESN